MSGLGGLIWLIRLLKSVRFITTSPFFNVCFGDVVTPVWANNFWYVSIEMTISSWSRLINFLNSVQGIDSELWSDWLWAEIEFSEKWKERSEKKRRKIVFVFIAYSPKVISVFWIKLLVIHREKKYGCDLNHNFISEKYFTLGYMVNAFTKNIIKYLLWFIVSLIRYNFNRIISKSCGE